MALTPNDIAAGKSYKTAGNQYRKVLKIEDGKVTYETGGSDAAQRKKDPSPNRPPPVSIEKFAADVVAEVKEHWDPRYPD